MCRNVAVFLFITIKDKDLLTGNEYGMVGTIIRKEWSLIPAGGVTGDAYIAQNGQQKLFLKRNTSPF